MRRAESVQRSKSSKSPEECPVCGQKIDRNSSASIEHHSNPGKHLPYSGKKKRVGWA